MLECIIWSQCRCSKTVICLTPSSCSSGSETVLNTNPVYLLPSFFWSLSPASQAMLLPPLPEPLLNFIRWLLFRRKPWICSFLPDWALPRLSHPSVPRMDEMSHCGMGLIFWAVTKGLDDTTQSSGESTPCELELDLWDMGNSREQGSFPLLYSLWSALRFHFLLKVF